MNCSKNRATAFRSEFYDRVEHLPLSVSGLLNKQANPYLQPAFLTAQEINNQHINQQYLGVFLDKTCVGFAVIQLLELSLPVHKHINTKCIITRHLIKKLGGHSSRKPFRLMVCGNIFINGKHGHFTDGSSEEQKTSKFITETLISRARKKNGSNIQAILFKDYTQETGPFQHALKRSHFQPIKTEPTMVLNIDKVWNSFDDYLLAMKTKYRTKAKKALKESAVLESKYLSADEISDQLEVYERLYKNVSSKSNFSLGQLNLKTYVQLKQQFPEQFFMKAYFYKNEPVGFMTAVKNNHTLDAHYVGLNYELNRKVYIYQRILYDYIKLAMQQNLLTINFGRSATEIKSSVGARAIDMHCYIKHRQPIHNTLLGAFLSRFTPDKSHEIMPFK